LFKPLKDDYCLLNPNFQCGSVGSDNINYLESILSLQVFVEFTYCTSLVTNKARIGDKSSWY